MGPYHHSNRVARVRKLEYWAGGRAAIALDCRSSVYDLTGSSPVLPTNLQKSKPGTNYFRFRHSRHVSSTEVQSGFQHQNLCTTRETSVSYHRWRVAQLVERPTVNRVIAGSSPASSAIRCWQREIEHPKTVVRPDEKRSRDGFVVQPGVDARLSIGRSRVRIPPEPPATPFRTFLPSFRYDAMNVLEPVAQPETAPRFERGDCRFESCPAHHHLPS